MDVSKNRSTRVPENGWNITGKIYFLYKMDDLGVPLFLETPTSYESFLVVDSVLMLFLFLQGFSSFVPLPATKFIRFFIVHLFVVCGGISFHPGMYKKKDIGKRGNFAPSPANPQEGWN